jgi:N-acylneuraminate cytidylyltransferase
MSVLAVIPARGGSKGLPGKNIRPFAGLPLIAHTIKFAAMCPEINRCVVSTDSPEIADVAAKYGCEVPSLRPMELAQDDTPLWPVLRHVLEQEKSRQPSNYDFLLLLDPTSPAREPADVAGSLRLLQDKPEADGVIGVSKPDFNPIWNCVIDKDGWMEGLIAQGPEYERRQDVPTVYRVNGSLYLWRTSFVRSQEDSWMREGKHLMHEIPEARAMSIDTADQFQRAELLVREGFIDMPWLRNGVSSIQ